MEPELIWVRLGQYLAVAGLFGGALFLARQSLETLSRGERRLLFGSALGLAVFTVADLFVQAAMMGGEVTPWSDPSMVGMVMTQTPFGYAVAVRLVAAAVAVTILLLWPRRPKLRFLAGLGAVATATLAWGGHGAADEGAIGGVHLVSDIVHLMAATLWIGALGVLAVMAFGRGLACDPAARRRFHAALEGFSGAGTLAVALLILTGVINSWFLIGPRHLTALIANLYGQLLLAKLGLFIGMIVLAAANRWRYTPRFGRALDQGDAAVAAPPLRRSVALETAAAGGVLILVAWLGTLAPPMSS